MVELNTSKEEELHFYSQGRVWCLVLSHIAPSNAVHTQDPQDEIVFTSVPTSANATESVDPAQESDYTDDEENEDEHEDLLEKHSSPKAVFWKRRSTFMKPKRKQTSRINMKLDVPDNALVSRQHPFDLILFTTAEASKVIKIAWFEYQNYGMFKIKNVIRMMRLFQQSFSSKGIVFTNSPAIRAYAKQAGICVISNYTYNLMRTPYREDQPLQDARDRCTILDRAQHLRRELLRLRE